MSAGSRASTGISGAREGSLSGLRRLLARAAARDLCAFVVPGPEVARAAGLDLEAAGLALAAGPRQANVLAVVVPEAGLPEALERAAEVAYAQMPRPRAALTLGSEDFASLPADARSEPDQASLEAAVGELRLAFREGAFVGQTQDFEAPALETRTTYTCPMHLEIEQDEPGQCPKCGMDLVPKQSASGEAGMHHEHGSHDHGSHEHGGAEGHDHQEHSGGKDSHEHAGHGTGSGGEREHGDHGHEGHGYEDHGHEGHTEQSGEYNGHAGDGDQDHDGQHEDGEGGGRAAHGGHDHGGHDEMGFMSMVEMTQGTRRSSDGLQMEWVDAPFGPFMPGLPGGLSLTLSLDGDTVAGAEASAQTADAERLLYGPASGLTGRLSGLDPLSPISYGLLATLALENAAGATVADDQRLRRIVALELERAASHAGWLAGFASLLGMELLGRDAARLELRLRRLLAEPLNRETDDHRSLQPMAHALHRRLNGSRLLRTRLRGVGALEAEKAAGAEGPVARAAGHRKDLRAADADYGALGFEPVLEADSDALSRLRLRAAELPQSLRLAHTALQGVREPGRKIEAARVAGADSGRASVETPRGAATLTLELEGGEVSRASLELPSAASLKLAETLAVGRELGDALAGVVSLDISPWGLG